MQLRDICIMFFFMSSSLMSAQMANDLNNFPNLSFPDSINKINDPVIANFMYSYYEQDGMHSPVTGGIGDEELDDIAYKISVNFPLNNNSLHLFLKVGLDRNPLKYQRKLPDQTLVHLHHGV